MNNTTHGKQIAQSQTLNNAERMTDTLPNHVNLEKWEDSGYTWSGQIKPRALERLVDMVPENYQNNPVNLTCELAKRGQLLTLNLDFSGNVWVTCQRCLQPLAIDITHQSQLVLLQSEEQQSLIDESDDYVLLDEIVISHPENRKFDRLLPLGTLVEDELLLDVPLSAKHENCEMALQQVGEIIEEESDNPFAVLESLKGKL